MKYINIDSTVVAKPAVRVMSRLGTNRKIYYINISPLLFISALSKIQADEIYEEALKNKLSVIVEVHNEKEAEIALNYNEAIIGINNRDLKSLNVSLDNSVRIQKKLLSHKGPLVSESGIKNHKDAQYIYDNTGIKNFLIGESILASSEPSKLIKEILSITL